MGRVVGMDVHRDFAQVVALEGDRLRQLGRVQLDQDSLAFFASNLASMMRLFSKQFDTHLPSFEWLRAKVGRAQSQTPCKSG
jgi:hypothetical protein